MKFNTMKLLISEPHETYVMEILSIDENEIRFKAPTVNQGDVIRIYKAVE